MTLPEDQEFDTVGGYLMACLGRVPEEGEMWEFEDIQMTAVETSTTQVARIRISRPGGQRLAPSDPK